MVDLKWQLIKDKIVKDNDLKITEEDVRAMAKEMATSSHFGLEIMRGRAQRLGATIEVGTNQRGGTRVRLIIPDSVLSPTLRQ